MNDEQHQWVAAHPKCGEIFKAIHALGAELRYQRQAALARLSEKRLSVHTLNAAAMHLGLGRPSKDLAPEMDAVVAAEVERVRGWYADQVADVLRRFGWSE